MSYPSDYVYSSYYTEQGGIDQFMPFEDNCAFSNFQYNASFGTAAHPSPTPDIDDVNIFMDTSSTFSTSSYVSSGSQAPIVPSLLISNSQWFLVSLFGAPSLPFCGVYQSGSTLYMSSGATNAYGLRYQSFEVESPSGPFGLMSPTQNMPATNVVNCDSDDWLVGVHFYSQVQPPALRTVDYYFARLAQFDLGYFSVYSGGWYLNDEYGYYPTSVSDPMPGNGSQAYFDTSNTTPLMITSVGQPLYIAGYAKQVANNGASNVFAYLGQYFTNAFQVQNGVLTTNEAAMVSEYGSFFPTLPGQIALLTRPDPDQGNVQGQCLINVIRLSLDVNHDGIMDESFTGPDNTSAEKPFVYWANNNYDRYTLDSDGTNYYDDDVASNSRDADDFFTGVSTPDCNFKNGAGNRIIPCERDLADFTRLWVSGVSNTLSRLPSGSTVTLSWAGNGTSPTIDLSQAANADGGIGYLTNSTIASEQVDFSFRPYIGRIGPGQSIQLNASTFSNNWAGDHFIWCGVATGNDQLNLTISDGSGNTLAQSCQYIQIVDIKQMYERWTLGDAPGATPRSNAVPAADSLPPGTTAPFQYAYDPATDTNTSYILYVHGWNMKPWEKDRFAESAFKRLYWQGYQGRFGLFRWPTGNGFSGELAITGNNPLTDPHNYDNSEFTAWKSAAGLLNKLTSLNAQYPGHVYMLAHSMGNVVAGEALRLAGTNHILNTYVAGQGAIPAHVYDSTVTNLIDFTHANSSIPGFFTRSSYGPGTPNIYTNWLTGNSAAVGRRINSYNQNDYALSPDNWCFDQELKPDGALTWQYHYQGTINDSLAQAQTKFYKTVFNGDMPTFFNLSFVSQRYEVMAYAAESRSGALGTTPITTMDGSLNLTTVWPTDTSGRSYRDHFWHSAEFRGDCWQEWNYWQTVLRSPTLGFNISN